MKTLAIEFSFSYYSIDICGLNLVFDKCSRADSLFYKNHGSRILVNLSESLDLTNVTRENIEVKIMNNSYS
jgi:hypothetical protein